MKFLDLTFGLIRIPLDYLMAMTAFILAFLLRQITDLIPGFDLPITYTLFPDWNTYLLSSAIFSAGLILINAFNGHYSLKKQENLSKQITKVFVNNTIWLFAIIAYYFFVRSFPFSRLVFLETWLISILTLSAGRILINSIQNQLYRSGRDRTNLLFIGSPQLFPDIFKSLKKDPRYKIIGYLDQKESSETKLKYRGPITQLEKIVSKYQVEKIVQLDPTITQNEQIDLLDFSRHNQIEYSFVPDQVQMQRSNIEIETINQIPIINLKPTPLDGWGRVIKRAFDFFGSLALIIVFSPFMLIIALLIKLDDPKGDIIFKKLDDGSRVKRIGQKGQPFSFYKFRTMKPNTHNLRYTDLAHLDTRKGSPMVKIKDDPRVTKIGRILRKTSLDELPQLFNVLSGEMSLVGPRPHLPEEVAKYKNHHRFVLTIKPGITGVAQTSGRSDLDFEKEIKLDTYYIENWSLWLDLKLLFKTLEIPFKKYEE